MSIVAFPIFLYKQILWIFLLSLILFKPCHTKEIGFHSFGGLSQNLGAEETIQKAGHTFRLLTNLNPSTLETLDVLWISLSAGGEFQEILNSEQTIKNFVSHGGILLFHDVGGAHSFFFKDIQFIHGRSPTVQVINNLTSVTDGPGGVISSSISSIQSNGIFLLSSIVPHGVNPIFHNGNPLSIIDYYRKFGNGYIYYSTVDIASPLHRRHSDNIVLNIYGPNVVNFVASLSVQKCTQLFDSQNEFSGIQGESNWQYGYYDGDTANPENAFSPPDFEEFPNFDNTETPRWFLSSGANGYWTELTATGGHPNGNVTSGGRLKAEHWSVRRWVSNVTGIINITINIADEDQIVTGDQSPTGITARVFVDNREVLVREIDNGDLLPEAHIATINVIPGTIVDFAIDPKNDNDLSDTTFFSVTGEHCQQKNQSSATIKVPMMPSYFIWFMGFWILFLYRKLGGSFKKNLM